MNTPEISLIMSVYNGEDYLSAAIDSVINQTFTNWELIVINDCSTDGTAQILEGYQARDSRVKVHTNEQNLRLPSSLNKALTLAQGKYIARMDADDICMPDRLEKQYAFMEQNGDIALSSCKYLTLKNGAYLPGGCGGRDDAKAIQALLLVTNPILHPGIIARAEDIKQLGYDKSFTCTEDMELWSRFVMAGKRVEIQPEYLMIYRLHDKQITGTTLDRQKGEVITLQKSYYSKFLAPIPNEQEEFYINGIYFTNDIDVNKFCTFFKWLKATNSKTKAIDSSSLSYAMLEILAEYKRKGLPKLQLIKGMLSFSIPFLIKELPARKKRARADGLKCIAAANKIGLEQTGGTMDFPTFSQRKTQE